MSTQEDIRASTGIVLQLCLVTVFQYLAVGLIIGLPVFGYALFQTGARAEYYRWMSLTPAAGATLGGLFQVIRILIRYAINRSKHRDTLS
jgi:hypothetical protein